MKNSTTKKSYKKVSPSSLGGLAFPSSIAKVQKKGFIVYLGFSAWVDAGKPDNCYIFHGVTSLVTLNIPLSDAQLVVETGAYVRKTAISKPTPTDLSYHLALGVRDPRFKKDTDKVTVYDTLRGARPTDKKMAYN